MFIGAHLVIFSADAEADRAFFRDVLGYAHVDAGEGWLIFAMPPAEAAFHPGEGPGRHEIYLMCEDVAATRDALSAKGVECDPVRDEGWGMLSALTLPGGGKLGFYQPRHPRAFDPA